MNRKLSYRGLLGLNAQEEILLSTKKGEVGYRITKFKIISNLPFQASDEHIVQIWKEPPTEGLASINFSDNRLLAAATINNDTAGYRYSISDVIIFDRDIINQDIFVTHTNTDGTSSCNYYIELEVIKLSEREALVATIMNIRNS